jgi:molybdopterin/thiamine biosynthesis adenylyltransferase
VAGLARLNASDPTIVIHAQNATVAATIRVSARGAIFQKSLARPAGWKRYVESKGALTLPIERSRYRRHDLAALLGSTSEDGRPVLADRHVVLIGCGSIGGYLARMLAQLGAGVEGKLTLIDKDILGGDNIRRHQLGLGDILLSKAKACAEEIRRDFPGLCVDGIRDEATRRCTLFADVDLIIDATGEQGFSEWLNDWRLERRATSKSTPAVLFVWIAGSGSAVQSFLVADEKFACYRCLQPDLQKPARFDPLKEAPQAPVRGCGDQPSTPYGPAAPAAAASLAVSQVSDWARGQFHPRLRTIRIDWDETVKRDPKSPDRAADCPACSRP